MITFGVCLFVGGIVVVFVECFVFVLIYDFVVILLCLLRGLISLVWFVLLIWVCGFELFTCCGVLLLVSVCGCFIFG